MGEQRASGRRRPGVAGVPHAPGTHVPVLLDRILDLLGPALTAHPSESAEPGARPAESGGRPARSADRPVESAGSGGRRVESAGSGGRRVESAESLGRPVESSGRAARSGGRPAVFVDATVGLGGHAEAVLAAHPGTTLVGLDRDPEALRRSGERLAGRDEEIHLVHAVYDELPDVLADLDIDEIDAALFDLGVSSLQLDEAERGFAYAQDAPLDMRMDPTTGITAEQVVNTYQPAELTRILRVYGEERYASRIAAAIVRARAQAPLTSSARLADLVRDAIPAPARRTGGHPAKRTFQALRIEVNGELAALEAALPAAVDALRVGGRIAVLSYHSLEDRIVKRELAGRARSTAPPDLPVVPPGSEPELRLLTRGGQEPTDAEIAANPRAASARLRAAERVRAAGHTTTGRAATGPKTRPGGTATRPRRRLLGDDAPPGDRPARQVPGEES